nr:immunoglobulin heavy chain junction region [Macaca mulatta]MOV47426.1 immunoglobulin heavy chain junction region [Macaca mulatta]MOV47431.1 immunoglobulin heavy chain junction region [Macaca mulatta]MOV47645.1 immunoglobulin heavy chain junction region [Macaca mulatta]MOV47733.1 immunoglobulin heavy chain junction region [Macaca mulatta]
CTRGEYW